MKKLIFLFFLSGCSLSAADPSPNIPGETIEQTAKRTGYTVEEIKKYFPPVETWLKYNKEGFAKERFKKPPKPYVHPRIYFNPEDLPAIRKRLKESSFGQIQMNQLRHHTGIMLYGKPEYMKANLPTVKRIAEKNTRPVFERLLAGKPMGVKPADTDGRRVLNLILLEAFRCLIDEDKEGARKLALAFINFLRNYDEKARKRFKEEVNWQHILYQLGVTNIGLIYDFLYNDMTEEQRKESRAFLSLITTGKYSQNARSLPGWQAHTSNWVSFHFTYIVPVLAIEGEEGFDEMTYRNGVETVRKWVAMGFFPSGASYESMGKNQLGALWFLPLAKRGENFLAAENARNHVGKWQLHLLQPTGRNCTFFTDHGSTYGVPRDVPPLKYAFPNDPAIDFVYRNSVDDPPPDPAKHTLKRWRVDHSGSAAHVVLGALLKSDNYDTSLSFDEALKKATKDEPLTFFCDGRGQMITRSKWGRDALWFLFQPENIHDGHSHGDRGTFTLSGLGRIWVENFAKSGGSHMGNSGESRYFSVVTVDDMGQGVMHTPPGRSIAFQDSELASFLASDAKDAYSYRTQGSEKKWEVTPNYHRIKPSPLPWMNLPWGKLMKQLDLDGMPMGFEAGSRACVDIWNPVQRAFRTAGLVRGKYPYVMIIDDIQKDDKLHDYKWLMQLPNDLEVERIYMGDFDAKQKVNPYLKVAPEGVVADVILKPKGKGKERLLVRVLDCNWRPDRKVAVQWPGYVETYQRDMRNQLSKGIGQRLVIPSRSVAPDYKVLLFPYMDQKDRKNIPITKWNSTHNKLTVRWPDQVDEFSFVKLPTGRTILHLERTVAPKGSTKAKPFVLEPKKWEKAVSGTILDPDRDKKVNLMGWWKMDGDGTDSSGNKNNGKLEKGAVFAASGKVGSGALESGLKGGTRLNCGSKPAATESFTVAFWAKPNKPHNASLVGKKNLLKKDSKGWSLMYRANGEWWLDLAGTIFKTGVKTKPGTWAHVACTYSPKVGVAEFYLNGRSIRNWKVPKLTMDPDGLFQIGHINGLAHSYTFQGLIDEVAVFDGTLSEKGINKIFRNGVENYKK